MSRVLLDQEGTVREIIHIGFKNNFINELNTTL
jgi:hypothetical protein